MEPGKNGYGVSTHFCAGENACGNWSDEFKTRQKHVIKFWYNKKMVPKTYLKA